jgi:hypothetical protein
VAEILEQFFALAAMLALILYFKHRARAYPLMMFIFLLCLFVCRIEGLLFVVAVVAAFLVRMVTGKFDRLDRWMVNCALAAGFISLVYAQTFIQPYFNSNANSAIYRFSRYINMPTQPAYFGMIVITLAAVVLNIKWFSMGLAKLGRYVSGLFADGPLKRIAKWRAAAAFLCGFLFLFLYLRYEVSPSPYHARPNFVRFTWMMGGAFIFLAVAGLCVLIYMSEPETAAYIFTVTVVSSLLFFGLRLSNDFVPWSLRRHISNVMPLFLLGAGCLAGLFWYMKSQWWKIVSAVVSVVLLVSFIPTTRTILADTAYANVKAEFGYIASVTPDCMVLSPDHETANLFGPVLRYGYGKDCYWIQARSNPRQLRDLVAKRRARGQRVVFMESPASPAAYKYVPWLKLKYTGAGFRFTWKALREFKHRAPSEWVGGVWKPGSIVGVPVAFYDVYPSAPVSEKQAETITLLGSDLKSGYVKNLIDRAWVRGVSEGAGNKSATAIKLPLEKGTKAIRVSINAQLADPEVSEMSIYANGQAVPVIKTVNGQEASYSFVIEAADQQPHSQAFLLRAPPLKIGTASSGIQLLEVQASFI